LDRAVGFCCRYHQFVVSLPDGGFELFWRAVLFGELLLFVGYDARLNIVPDLTCANGRSARNSLMICMA